ncbi:ATP-binding protein [Telmatospirillum siberiense]|uniref:ATP-binding protein n=1 Tax=Telmatospirillum siberiense TaxID=382514 RepID=UPI00130448BB|nr:ATP-binding protein [Telmatospirillum siberiense]
MRKGIGGVKQDHPASEATLKQIIERKCVKAWAAIRLSPMTWGSWSLLILIWGGALLAAVYLRNAAIKDAETDIRNMTRVIAAESEVVFRDTETILLATRHIIESDNGFELAKAEQLLTSRQALAPYLHSVSIVDAEGRFRYLNNFPQPADDHTVTTREWFASTRDTPTRDLIISPPMKSSFSPGSWLIPLSLRLENPDHSFRGAVMAALDPAFFMALFRDLDLVSGSAVTLLRRDSMVLSRNPFDETLLGKRLLNGHISRMLQSNKVAVSRNISVVTGDARVLGGRVLDSFPVFVAISMPEAAILTVWRAQMILIIAATLIISLLLLVVMYQSDQTARLDAKSEAMQSLIDASPRSLATLRRSAEGPFVIDAANSHFADLFGRSLPDILDQPLRPLLEGASSSPLPHSIDDPKGVRCEIILDTPHGPTETQLLFTPVEGKNAPPGSILVTTLDMAARRSAALRESERHLFEALGRMAGQIAHEINNVLQPILSHASLALHAAPDNEQAATHLHEIQKGVRAGREIVRSVLTLAGNKTVSREQRSVEEELRGALDLIRPTVPDRITLDTDLHATGWRAPLASGEMFQILSNLVRNAIDAIEGSGTIRIELTPCEIDLIESVVLGLSPGNHVQLLVIDTGAGMEREIVLRALDPFFTTKPFGKGVGLGLSTVQSIVASFEGSISLSSTLGKGTSIRILFPSEKSLC